MKHPMLSISCLAAIMLSSAALATVKSVKDMEDGSQVNLTGTVDSVQNEREFKLRDATGVIRVDIESNQSVVLKQGDNVTVIGRLDKGPLVSDINARAIKVNKPVAQAVSDAIEGQTTLSLEGATTYNISQLPEEGLVKVNGTVTNVANEKKFTVKDVTGSIKVDVESAETAALTEGAEVTVIGYVDSGLFGKALKARKVLVVASAAPAE